MSVEPANTVQGDARCLSCGYLLTGLPRSSACPECGRPALTSDLRLPLTILDDVHAARLASSLWCILGALRFFTIGLGFLLPALFIPAMGLVTLPCWLTAGILWTTGWCRLAFVRTVLTPDIAPLARMALLIAALSQAPAFWCGVVWAFRRDSGIPMLLVPAAIGAVMVAGRCWLAALARHAGNPAWILGGARRTARVQYGAIGMSVLAWGLLFVARPPLGEMVAVFAALAWFWATLSIWAMLREFQDCAERRAGWRSSRPA